MKKRLSRCRRGPARHPRPRASRTPALVLALPRPRPTALRLLRPRPRLNRMNPGRRPARAALPTSGEARCRAALRPAAARRLPAGRPALLQAPRRALQVCQMVMLSAAMSRAPRQRPQLLSLLRADGRGCGACCGKQAHHQCCGRKQEVWSSSFLQAGEERECVPQRRAKPGCARGQYGTL